jgi:hypothetical protein
VLQEGLPPVHRPQLLVGRDAELVDEVGHHRLQQVLAAVDVVVDRHRLDAEKLSQPPHGERAEPVLVHEGDGTAHDRVTGEGWTVRRCHGASGWGGTTKPDCEA